MHSERKTSPQKIFSCLNIPLNSNVAVFSDFRNTVLYAPFSYLPQVGGIMIGKVFHLTPLTFFYLSRLITLLCSILLIFIAIKITPVLKWGLVMLALMPMSLFELASVSYDSLTISFSFLLTAIFLHFAFMERKISSSDIFLFFGLSLLVSLSKLAYVPLIFLYFLIPVEKIGSLKKYLFIFCLLCFLTLAITGLWTYVAQEMYIPITGMGVINPHEQLIFILKHPFHVLITFFRIFWESRSPTLRMFVGQLGYLEVRLPSSLPRYYFFVLLFTAFFSCEQIKLSVIQRATLWFSFLTNLILLIALVYLSSVTVGADDIKGGLLQGRYLIPFSYVFFLLFYHRFKSNVFLEKIKPIFLTIFSFATLCITVVVLIQRYYF
jgi:uncharacterized membrane protein